MALSNNKLQWHVSWRSETVGFPVLRYFWCFSSACTAAYTTCGRDLRRLLTYFQGEFSWAILLESRGRCGNSDAYVYKAGPWKKPIEPAAEKQNNAQMLAEARTQGSSQVQDVQGVQKPDTSIQIYVQKTLTIVQPRAYDCFCVFWRAPADTLRFYPRNLPHCCLN